MFQILREHLEANIDLTEENYAMIKSVAIQKRVRKRQYFLQEGDTWDTYIFVCEGCMRQFRTDEKNNEWTMYFATENWWIADAESFAYGKVTTSNLDAVEDSTLIIFKNEDFVKLKSVIPNFGNFIERLLLNNLITAHNRIFDLISKSAEDRYLHLLETHPSCIRRAPLHMIASYLGLSRETISRIRAQLVKP